MKRMFAALAAVIMLSGIISGCGKPRPLASGTVLRTGFRLPRSKGIFADYPVVDKRSPLLPSDSIILLLRAIQRTCPIGKHSKNSKIQLNGHW